MKCVYKEIIKKKTLASFLTLKALNAYLLTFVQPHLTQNKNYKQPGFIAFEF